MKVIDNKPEYIVLYSTTDCNHACAHCFLEHNMNWDPDELERVASILSKKCLVHINGAEPLLHPEYLKAYKCAKQTFIFTNGLVFLNSNSEDLMKKMKENGIKEVRLSHHFQAIESLNAVSREKVEWITNFLITHGFEVHYNSTVTIDNFNYIEENCYRAFQLGVKRIKFFPLKEIGRAKKMEHDYGLSQNQMKEFYNQLLRERKKYNITDLSIKVSGDLSDIAPKFKCTYGVHSYAITPDKKVHGCVYSISNLPPIGELQEDYSILLYNSVEHDCKRCLLV